MTYLVINEYEEFSKKTTNISKLLHVIEYSIPIAANEIINKLGIKSKESLRFTYLDSVINE